MIAFICLFLPAVLSVCIFEKLSNTGFSLKKWICTYSVDVLFINFICFCVKRIILNTASEPLYVQDTDMLPSVALNYLIMAIPIAVVCGIAGAWFSKSVNVTIEDKENDQ